MRVLLTGVSGFIGRRLFNRFAERGDTVTGLVRSPVNLSGGETVVVPRLTPENIGAVISGRSIDVVVNLAAAGVTPSDRDPSTLTQINSFLPCALAVIARDAGAKAFIQIGSSAEYARTATSEPITEESPLENEKLYGASKAAAALLTQAFGAQIALPVMVLRLFNVFGPGEAPHRLLPSLVTKLNKGQGVSLSAGTQIRDFIHVDDACAGITAAVDALLANPALAGCYNLSTGIGTTVKDFALIVAGAMQSEIELLRFGELLMRPDDLPYVVGCPDKFTQKIGWKPNLSLLEGVSKSVKELIEADR